MSTPSCLEHRGEAPFIFGRLITLLAAFLDSSSVGPVWREAHLFSALCVKGELQHTVLGNNSQMLAVSAMATTKENLGGRLAEIDTSFRLGDV